MKEMDKISRICKIWFGDLQLDMLYLISQDSVYFIQQYLFLIYFEPDFPINQAEVLCTKSPMNESRNNKL